MSIAILGMGTSRGKDLTPLKTNPEFRKATANMILAAASQDEALSSFSAFLTKKDLGSSALILGSSHGELETTVSFLDHLSRSGVARPLLFQNSLHNSTLGFLAMRLQLTGPALTVSNRFSTGEDSLDLALTLLNERERPFCIVTAVDTQAPQLENLKSVSFLGEGAATLVLSRQETAEKMGWPVLAYLHRIEYLYAERPVHPARGDSFLQGGGFHSAKPYYDSDALERLIEHVRSKSGAGALELQKPNGNKTVFYLEWPAGASEG